MSPLETTILEVLACVQRDAVPRTKLVKLVYFIDYIYFQQTGCTLTGTAYVWDHYGPNAQGNAITKAAERLARLGAIQVLRERPNQHGTTTHYYRANLGRPVEGPPTDDLAATIVQSVVDQYRWHTPGELADASKLTPPFEQASPGELLDMDRPGAFYRSLPSAPKPLTKRQLDELEQDRGITLDEAIEKYAISGVTP